MDTIYDAKLLLVDDNAELLALLCEQLRGAGYCRLKTAQSCAAARACFAAEQPELMILDINLPDGDGFSLFRALRAKADVPALFLSARDADADRLFGLGLGADDYLTKPFLMQELLLRVSEIIGFEPDGYAVVDLSVFEQLVDLMGGITFDVPVDMHYSDPTQGLNIDLQAGRQHLNGEQAMQVARFRSGYATADLGRIEVQRSLVSSALRQWVSPKGMLHLSKAVKLVLEHTNTNLTKANLLWLAESFLLCGRSDIASATLPGYAANFTSGSYYVLDAGGVADIVNRYLNPYEKEVQAAELYIRNG